MVVIEQPEVVCKTLTHLGMPTAAPEFAAARRPPLLALAAAGVGDERRVELDAEFVEPEVERVEDVGAGGRLLGGAVRRSREFGSIAACLVASPPGQVVVDGAWAGA